MAQTKSATLTVRIQPAVKEGLRAMAEKERRSLANMLEVMILDYCEKAGVALKEQSRSH